LSPGFTPRIALGVCGAEDLQQAGGDPLADLGVLAEPAHHLRAVVQDGAVVVDRR
jgi:hypothetical protein